MARYFWNLQKSLGLGIQRQKLILVTGKGGVGKSTYALNLAQNLSHEGKKCLLVELGDRSFYSGVLKTTVSFTPSEVSRGFWVACWSGEACLREYFSHLLKSTSLVNLLFENKVMKSLVGAAPALNELSIMGKLTSGIREIGPKMDYDYIVLDGYSSGHFKALINAPRGMAEAISVGPMGMQGRHMDQVLRSPEQVEFHIVTLPEELPVEEAIQLNEYLNLEFQSSSQVILNQWLPEELIPSHLDNLIAETNSSVPFLEYLKDLKGRQKKYLLLLEEKFSNVRLFPKKFQEPL